MAAPARLLLSGLIVACLAACGLPDEPVPLPPMRHSGATVALPDDPAREFDFWLGTWNVQNRHLKFTGSWKETGTAEARIDSVAGGRAVLERWTGEAKGRLYGFSLRSWDPELGKWLIALNWHGGEPRGFFVMHGERRGERIELFPPGGSRASRYTFSEAHEGSCQWDSATRAGEHWITDWVMQFTRSAEGQRVDASTSEIISPPAAASDFAATRQLDELIGRWESDDGQVRVAMTSMLEGFGLLQFLDTAEGEQTLAALAHDGAAGGWRAYRASSVAQGLEALTGSVESGRFHFAGSKTRETWIRRDADAYSWRREELRPDGSWTTRFDVPLTRRR